MIYMDKGPLGTIRYGDIESPIKSWEVWFMTMRGYHKDLPSALKDAEETEMPPELIRPITVAVAENGLTEPVHKA